MTAQTTYPRGLALAVITTCTVLATLMQALDSTIANVALPYMQGSMAASQDEINWVLTSYIVTAAIMTATVGFLASRLGRTRLFVASVIGFTVASVLCGMAQNLDQLVLFRCLQGACGAGLAPLSQAVLYEIYPVEKRGGAMALWGTGIQVGPALGPIAGGWLTQDYSWRWVFFVNVPFGIAATAGLLIFLRETKIQREVRLDWIGFLALSLAIGALQLMLDRGEELDWFSSPEIITEACLAGLGFYIFLVQSVTVARPYLSPRLFLDTTFVVGCVFIFVIGLVMYAGMALQAPYLQALMGYPVMTDGIALAPRGAGTAMAMILAGRLMSRISVRKFMLFGLILNVYALYSSMYWTPDVSMRTVVFMVFIQGLGMGFVFAPLSTIVYATLPLELRTEAAGVFSLLRNLGSSIGISVTIALLQTNTEVNHAVISAIVTPFNRMVTQGHAGLFWNPFTPGGAAALDGEITRQASIIAYNDDFKLLFLLSAICIPLVAFVRSGKPAVRVAPAA